MQYHYYIAPVEVPNLLVDAISQKRLACYPQRTYYPLCHDLTIRNHGITITNFRFCSACKPLSQASICYCAQRLLTTQSELTFVLLRYSLGERRPSETTSHALFLYQLMVSNQIKDYIRKVSHCRFSNNQNYYIIISSLCCANIIHNQYKIVVKVLGTFRLTMGTPHLHGELNFTKLMLKTVRKSLNHSCRSQITRQGISLPQDDYSYRRRLPWLMTKAINNHL